MQAALTAGALDVPIAERLCGSLAALPDTADEATVRVLLVQEVPGLLQELTGGADPDPTGATAVLQACADADTLPLGDRLEPAWVLLATRLPAARVAPVLSYLTDALLPEEHLQRWQDEQARTDLRLRTLLDGYCDVRGLLDPETAAALHAELDARRVAPAPTANGTPGTPGTVLGAGQRRVLALRQLLRDAASRDGSADATQTDETAEPAANPQQAQDADDAANAAPPTADVTNDADPGDAPPAVDAADGRVAMPAADGEGVHLTLVSRPHRPLSPLTFPVLASVDTILGRPGALPAGTDRPWPPACPPTPCADSAAAPR